MNDIYKKQVALLIRIMPSVYSQQACYRDAGYPCSSIHHLFLLFFHSLFNTA